MIHAALLVHHVVTILLFHLHLVVKTLLLKLLLLVEGSLLVSYLSTCGTKHSLLHHLCHLQHLLLSLSILGVLVLHHLLIHGLQFQLLLSPQFVFLGRSQCLGESSLSGFLHLTNILRHKLFCRHVCLHIVAINQNIGVHGMYGFRRAVLFLQFCKFGSLHSLHVTLGYCSLAIQNVNIVKLVLTTTSIFSLHLLLLKLLLKHGLLVSDLTLTLRLFPIIVVLLLLSVEGAIPVKFVTLVVVGIHQAFGVKLCCGKDSLMLGLTQCIGHIVLHAIVRQTELGYLFRHLQLLFCLHTHYVGNILATNLSLQQGVLKCSQFIILHQAALLHVNESFSNLFLGNEFILLQICLTNALLTGKQCHKLLHLVFA